MCMWWFCPTTSFLPCTLPLLCSVTPSLPFPCAPDGDTLPPHLAPTLYLPSPPPCLLVTGGFFPVPLRLTALTGCSSPASFCPTPTFHPCDCWFFYTFLLWLFCLTTFTAFALPLTCVHTCCVYPPGIMPGTLPYAPHVCCPFSWDLNPLVSFGLMTFTLPAILGSLPFYIPCGSSLGFITGFQLLAGWTDMPGILLFATILPTEPPSPCWVTVVWFFWAFSPACTLHLPAY